MAETGTNAPAGRIGILGGGQLAMYLCEAGRRLGMATTVIAHGEDSPAARTADRFLEGELDDFALIDGLAGDVDVITFEVEDIPPQTLKRLASLQEDGYVAVHPHPSTMLMLQDKLLQKRWLLANGLPTNLGRPLEVGPQHPDPDPDGIRRWFGYPFVQKARRGGYDGRGVQVIRGPDTPLWPVPSVIEPFLADVRELAVLTVRRADGQVDCYPPVELEFDRLGNVLRRVLAPAALSSRLKDLAEAIARRAVGRLHGAGVFAVELFLTPGGEMLVNEISPRVHNSGHHTLESCRTSQFEQHMRVISGRPSGSTSQRQPAVMLNLLSDGRTVSPPALPSAAGRNVHVHWYGKQTPRPLRKMGHLTAIDSSRDAASARANRAEAALA